MEKGRQEREERDQKYKGKAGLKGRLACSECLQCAKPYSILHAISEFAKAVGELFKIISYLTEGGKGQVQQNSKEKIHPLDVLVAWV